MARIGSWNEPSSVRPSWFRAPTWMAGIALVATGFGSSLRAQVGPRVQREVLPGGLVRVTNSGVSAWTARTGWRLEEDLRLGALDGGGPEQFSRIAGVLADSAGMIYVLDFLAQEIRVFGPDGAFSHAIGGRGEGPGEFMSATAMAFDPDGALWITDGVVTNRYSAFDRDGTFRTSHRRQLFGFTLPGGFMEDGGFVDWGLAFPNERPGVVAGDRIMFHPILFSEGFRVRDSLPPLAFSQRMVASGTLPQLFFREGLEVYIDRGEHIWFAHTGDYRIFRRSLEGDTTLVFSLPARPASVTELDRENLRTTYKGRRGLSEYLSALPETKPLIRRIFGDGAGHVYVVPQLADVPDGTVVDVFRDTGEYLGRLDLPQPIAHTSPWGAAGSLDLIYATEDHIYYVIQDQYDVTYLSRLRIDRSN